MARFVYLVTETNLEKKTNDEILKEVQNCSRFHEM
jgi:hypothetical protein